MGLIVLRGLVLKEYKPDDRIIIFLGLSSYVAAERGPQDLRGTMLSKFGSCNQGIQRTDRVYRAHHG